MSPIHHLIHSPSLCRISVLFACREQLVHQLKLDLKDHEEKLQRERAKRVAQLQVGGGGW